jgi:hypothetical protein
VNKQKKTQAEETLKQITFSWPDCVAAHNFLAQQHFYPTGGLNRADIYDFAMRGDIVAQAYIFSLRKSVLSDIKDGQPAFYSYTETVLLNHIRRGNEILCELAGNGRLSACGELWEESLKLSKALCELALKYPEAFKARARKSLYMPSIRTTNPKFSADAKAIGEAIELSAETVGGNLQDNRKRIGALCAQLVGECVDEITRSRSLWCNPFTRYNRPVVWPTTEQIKPFFGKNAHQLISESNVPLGPGKETMETRLLFFCVLDGCGAERLHFLTLPDLTTQTASIWWKGAIEKMVEARFPSLVNLPAWEKELRAVSTGTKADMLKELKDYCIGKVKQFAPTPSRSKAAPPSAPAPDASKTSSNSPTTEHLK